MARRCLFVVARFWYMTVVVRGPNVCELQKNAQLPVVMCRTRGLAGLCTVVNAQCPFGLWARSKVVHTVNAPKPCGMCHGWFNWLSHPYLSVHN